MKSGAQRLVIGAGVLLALWVAMSGAQAKRVIILGIDGMDPQLLQQYVDAGLMPHFKRLIEQGSFSPLQTSMPPQSPVAWSTFITGMDPGGHGIFDFVHRDPKTMLPELSMSRAVPSRRNVSLGSWVIPLQGGGVEQLRKGQAFWQILEAHGVPTTVFRIPVNFPPVPSSGKSFSGMGTPDIRGTPGTFSFYTDNPPDNKDGISGGEVYEVEVVDHRVDARLIGPKNTFRRVVKEAKSTRPEDAAKVEYENPDCAIDFSVFLDPSEPVAKFVVQDDEFILREGEWSEWIRVDFDVMPPLVGVSAIGRFYLQQVRPHFKLYVTPLQINPEEPALPLSTPSCWCCQLCASLGYFYTQELAEDTKAFSSGIFSGKEFSGQADFVYREQRKALDYMLENFDKGLLFFYFSSLDQQSHMLWHYMDPDHPGHDPTQGLQHALRSVYVEMDEALGRTLEFVDENTVLIVMSDHGFCPFYWGVNLNSWLVEQGYVKLRNPSRQGQYKYFGNVDWKRTKAYALGLNGLYINLKGREPNGIVEPGREYDELLDQLERDMLALRDPRNGRQPITLVTRTQRDFHGPERGTGPDIIVGYDRGYRSSWKSPLGEFPREIFVDNLDPWSADHCIDYRVVPGILVTNQQITLDRPALYDLTVAVLDEFGVKPLPEMIGKDCLAPPDAGRVAAAETD